MTRRLLLSYLTVTLLALLLLEIPLGVFYADRERDRLTADIERDARVIATIYEDALERNEPLDPSPAAEYERRTDARVVVVNKAGISQIDTQQPVNRDLSTRPEIRTALEGRRAVGTRHSETLGTDFLYVAVPVASGGVVHGALRVTLDAGEVNARIRRFWFSLVAVALVVLGVVALVGWAIASSVTRPLRRLNHAAARYAKGDLTPPTEPIGGPPELRDLGATMSTMAVRLDELIDEQRSFVADASHQLRTPLTALRLRLENLQSRVDADHAAELDTAIDETSRLADLVADLLRLARADKSRPPVAVDLVAIAAERVEIWSSMGEDRQVQLVLDAPPGPLIAHAVPGAVEQILDNVIDNAMSATDVGTTVVVSVRAGEREHTVTITDAGPGLSDDDKLRAVRRFWRGSATHPGTGLGLAIATSLAQSSGGRLVLADAPGHGLAVSVVLPAGGVPSTT